MTIGEYIRERRLAVGLSQSQLSGMLGFSSPQFVSKCERGVCKPCREKLAKWMFLIKADNNKIVRIWTAEWVEKLKKDLELKK